MPQFAVARFVLMPRSSAFLEDALMTIRNNDLAAARRRINRLLREFYGDGTLVFGDWVPVTVAPRRAKVRK